MSTSAISLSSSRATFAGRLADFIELSKPRIAVLLLFVVGASSLLANFGQVEPWRIAHAILGTLLVAASSSAGNQWLERRSDCLMRRTANRPKRRRRSLKKIPATASCRAAPAFAWTPR